MGALKIAVLRGGPSEEYDVSMRTGSGVLAALKSERNARKYEPIDITITRTGEWLRGGYVRKPEQILHNVDVVFLALHGSFGEDGTVQRLLDRFGVRYTGSKAYPSALGMNKVFAKDLLRQQGVKMPRHMIVTRDAKPNLTGLVDSLAHLLGSQFVVKPIASGSSLGVLVAENKSELLSKLSRSLDAYDQVLVEERIIGKEGTCGVLDNFRNQKRYVLPSIEIVPPENASFFDYSVKYDGSTQEICPGRFSVGEKQEMERIARLAHDTLGLSQYSRSDFMIKNGDVYFLEVNTLPGLTEGSLLPIALAAVGCQYDAFVDHLLTDAHERPR